MLGPRVEHAKWGPCLGDSYIEGTKQPTTRPSQYEDFQAECTVCHERIGLVVGTDHLKMHESKFTWVRKPWRPKPRPKLSRAQRRPIA